MALEVQYLCKLCYFSNHSFMPNDYKPDWDIYTCNIEEHPAIIGLDLDLRRFAPLNNKPFAVHISVYLNDPRPDGFPKGEEFEILGAIEDALVQQLEISMQAHFTGRTISDGVRDFYFYTANPSAHETCISSVMARFPGYKYEYGVKEDKNWELYFDFLFPDTQEFQRMQNRKVLRTLKQHGDLPEKVRHIDHWIFFHKEADRDYYWKQIQPVGFAVEGWPKETDSEFPYGLQVSRNDKTDEHSIDETVMLLWELAQELNARYDGWETVIVAQ
jgi:regulator of RNase E activity RraB